MIDKLMIHLTLTEESESGGNRAREREKIGACKNGEATEKCRPRKANDL